MSQTKRILVIFPRKLKQLEEEYMESLKKDRHEVRCLLLDTDTCDEIGLISVEENEKNMIWAQEIHLKLSLTNSKELTFLLGQIRMLNWFQKKKLVLINTDHLTPTGRKSIRNIMLAMHFELKPGSTLADLENKINEQKGRE